MNRIASTLLLLMSLCSLHTQALANNEKAVKVWGGSTGILTRFRGASGDLEMQGNWLEAGISYKFTDNFFAEISYSDNQIDSFEFNGEIAESEDTWTSTRAGIGFRSYRADTIGLYFGASYHQSLEENEEDENDAMVSLFMEKDTNLRFGRLGIARPADRTSGTTIGGRHVWFWPSGLGLGLDWSYESGLEEAVKYTSTTGGLVVMFRM